ncbi:hypothetical protein [Lysinibacillus xylanilyticus]|uniref:hypothetical protein n=1 Tax=Lysinibacillus xylanilyticus TaxID=582475 RepID=UPI00380732D6
MVKEIPLQNGMVALVDDEDFERVSCYSWRVSKNKETNLQVSNETTGKKIILSRFILNIKEDVVVTFKNKNQLDLRKSNLCVIGVSDQKRMAKGARGSSSKYKGVYWNKRLERWVANISFEGKKKSLGQFVDEDDAALAYNDGVMKYWGGIGYLNVIGEDNSAEKIEIEQSNRERCKRENKLGYRGIRKSGNKYESIISRKYLGTFLTKEQAAKAYDQKAFELYSDKAILNFPELKSEYEQALKEVTQMKIKPVPVALVSQAITKTVSARQK